MKKNPDSSLTHPHSEEDIKIKVIVPFLVSLGFNQNELHFERSFNVKLGRYSYKTNTEKQVSSGQARLDILVTVNGKNYFIVEAKTDSKTLSQEDKDQAISYARLVHPMAPFAIVTNGSDWKIYDTISKNELSRVHDFRNCTPNLDIDLIYQEAFEYFIGYSLQNLSKFCEAQTFSGLKPIIGSILDKNKKFIPELYLQKEELRKQLSDFMTDSKSVFAIVGESGSGKTCELCGITLKLLENNHSVLFYRGTGIFERIGKTIANDFNWVFSAAYDESALFRKINKINNETLYIVIDGIDEWRYENKVEDLSSFVSKSSLKKIKFIVSCKQFHWEKFLSTSGIPTLLTDFIYKFNDDRCFRLGKFSEREFYQLVCKYRHFYKFSGGFEGRVLEECKRSPFLLRLFFEVADSTENQHLTLSMKAFYEKYLDQILLKVDISCREKAIHQIKKVAQCLVDHGVDSVDMDTVRKDLSLGVTDSLLPELLENNVFEIVTEGHETVISFYFQRLRDYVVSFLIRKWHKEPDNVLKEDYYHSQTNNILLEAIKLFYQLSSEAKQIVIDRELRENAVKYLDFYTKTLSDHFPNLRRKFNPQTIGEIGFIAEYNIRQNSLWMYGFREITEGKERIKFIPVDSGPLSRKDHDSNLSYLHGASDLHCTGSSNGFQKISIVEEVMKNEVISQLEGLVKKCNLYEGECYFLSLERVLGCLNKLGFFKERGRSGVQSYLPISFYDIRTAVRYKNAYRYFENELIDAKRRDGVIRETWHDSIVSYSVSFSDKDREYLHRVASEAASDPQKDTYSTSDVDSKKIQEDLFNALEVVEKKTTCIDSVIMPDTEYSTRYIYGGYTKDTVKKVIKNIYNLYLYEYEKLIECNFPTYKQAFRLFSEFPIQIIIGIGDDFDEPGNYGIKIWYCKNHLSNNNSVTVVDDTEFVDTNNDFQLMFRSTMYQCLWETHTSFRSLFSNGFVEPKYEFPFSVLAGLIYRRVWDELKVVTEQMKVKG